MEEIFKLLNDRAEFHTMQANNYPKNSTLRAFHNGQAAAYEFSASKLKQNTLIKTDDTNGFDRTIVAIDTAIARYEKLISVKEVIEEMRKKALENIDMGEHPNHASFAYQEGVLISNQQALDIYKACFQ